jgi:hypothetical protein
LPNVQDGEVRTLSGWARTEAGWAQPLIGLAFGVLDTSGMIHFDVSASTNSTDWTFLSFTDTIHIALGETALVVLHPGLVGGPLFGYANFDGIELSGGAAQGITEQPNVHFPHFPDPVSDRLSVAIGDHPVIRLTLFDAAGHALPVPSFAANGTLQVDASALNTGLYFLRIATADGFGTVRFVKN